MKKNMEDLLDKLDDLHKQNMLLELENKKLRDHMATLKKLTIIRGSKS